MIAENEQASFHPRQKREERPARPAQWILGGFLIALVPSIFFFAQLARPGGLLNLLEFGTQFEAVTIPSVAALHPPRNFDHGHDGQWYAQLAMDPLLRDERTVNAIEYVEYRGRRIGLPVLARALALGDPARTLNILASFNYVFLLVLLASVIVTLRPAGATDWAAVAGAVLTTGAMDSLHRALTDVPVATLTFIAVMLPLAATRVGLLASTVLMRETALISAIPCVLSWPLRDWRNLIRLAAILVPIGLWSTYLLLHLGGLRENPGGNFQLPGLAIIHRVGLAWTEFIALPNDRRALLLLTPFCLLVQAWYFWRYPLRNSALWWSGIGYTALLLILGSQPWSGSISTPRVVLPMTVAFNVLLGLHRPKTFWFWFVAGNIGLLWGLRKLTIDLGLI